MHDPREPHLPALKRILHYIRDTLDLGLWFHHSSTTGLVAYSDAKWGSFPSTRRSTSDYCVALGDILVTWSSQHQRTVSRSSVEAEYCGVANVVVETCWMRNLLCELHTRILKATIVYCDNISVVYLSTNHFQHQKTKHIEIDIHFAHDKVATGQVRVLHITFTLQYYDIFTKGLPTSLFFSVDFRDSLSIQSVPTARTAGDINAYCIAYNITI